MTSQNIVFTHEDSHAGYKNFMWAIIWYTLSSVNFGIWYGTFSRTEYNYLTNEEVSNPVVFWLIIAGLFSLLGSICVAYGFYNAGKRKKIDLDIQIAQINKLEELIKTQTL
ncbi:hypothetical protein [Timonella sp. A28]|uniref:hypothetical protein n=1 Tax=Timonella sp. A28 TaxID=3442640 RepID=UPI003EC15376